ncbi:DUF7701 domain-containing protein [Microtetraspora malaysiensis]|uniref:DUF7701 domain-containing protein n=1 Tax=Microtetraspora malaysiensis TaxID=161358 RepID=UPI003D8DFF27
MGFRHVARSDVHGKVLGVTYLSDDAQLIRGMLADTASPPEDSDSLFLLYAVLLRAKGTEVSPSDVHDAWSAWMQDRDPDHPALVPFEQLDLGIRAEDSPYVEAIRKAALCTRR